MAFKTLILLIYFNFNYESFRSDYKPIINQLLSSNATN
jgi:hypothetical protein